MSQKCIQQGDIGQEVVGAGSSRLNSHGLSEAEQLQAINRYLAAGHGRGRLISAATIYESQVGYFCVQQVMVDGKRQDSILFVTPDTDIVISSFPAQPDTWGRSAAERNRMFQEARRA